MEVITFAIGLALGWLFFHVPKEEPPKAEPIEEEIPPKLAYQYECMINYDGKTQPEWRDDE